MTRKPYARDLGLPLGGTPGPCDAITDVAGVRVGFTTLADPRQAIMCQGQGFELGLTAQSLSLSFSGVVPRIDCLGGSLRRRHGRDLTACRRRSTADSRDDARE